MDYDRLPRSLAVSYAREMAAVEDEAMVACNGGMLATWLLAISLAIQLAAAGVAVYLARGTRWWLPWLALTAAFLLMTARRVTTLVDAMTGGGAPDLRAEAIALGISGFILAAVLTLRPVLIRLKESEAELRKSEARIRDFARSSSDWFWEQDAHGRFSYISSIDEKLSGLRLQQHPGRSWKEAIASGMTEEHQAAYQRALDQRLPFRDLQYALVDESGRKRYLSLSGAPTFDGGRFVGYRGSGREITDLVEMQQEVEAERDRAIEASRAKSEFLSSMSHELRTPLNAVIGFSDMLGRELFGALGHAKYREYAADIKRSAEHLLGIINDLLDLAKVEAGKLTLEESAIELDEIVKGCVTLMELDARKRALSLEMMDGPAIRLRADRRLLRQMVLNLLSNAIKFTPTGGTVTIGIRMESERPVIAVHDTGTGMSEEDLEKVGQPFFKRATPYIRHGESTGLGLAIVKEFVAAHGGELAIESRIGGGTAASLILPRDRVIAASEAIGSR